MLADYIVNTNSTVISFNWDILIDEALHNTNKWFYCTGYGFEFKRMYKDKKEFKCDGTKSRELLLKPHGSINWFRYMDFVTNTKNGFTGEKVSDGDKKDTYLFEFSRRFNNLSKVRMHPVEKKLNLGANYSPRLKMPAEIDIVPPGTKYDRSNHGKIWKQVEKSIAEADEIIAIGFALKDDSKEDKEEIEIFKRARKAHKKLLLKIVGKSLELDEKRDELMGRYKKIFSPNKTEFKFSSFKDYCKNIKMH
jgi:hypothetical protein